MYIPEHFKEDQIPLMHDAIRHFRFGTLVTFGQGGLEASHIPMGLDTEPQPCGTLYGHIARANAQWRKCASNASALAIFLGPSTYVTPSWYPTKRQTEKVVPTWNYVAVHAYGNVGFFDDRLQLKALVEKMTETQEAQRPTPWKVSDAPADFIDSMLERIVGFRLTITKLEGSWKLGQNRSAEDIAGVCSGLRAEGREDMASMIQNVLQRRQRV